MRTLSVCTPLLLLVCLLLPAACQQTPVEVRSVDTEGRQAELARLRQAIRGGQGSVDRGRVLFASRCGTCHQLGDTGHGRAGPDLATYPRDRDAVPYLLQVIAFPDAEIHPYHTMFEIRTRDGRVLTGVMVDRDDEQVTLIDADGDELVIAQREIDRKLPQYTSLMPDHLLASMTEQQVVDLFAFLIDE